MTYDLMILRAVMRLSRTSREASLEALNVRCGGEAADVRASLRRLEALGLVTRGLEDRARLTLSGLAVSVAAVAPSKRGRAKSKPCMPAPRRAAA